jgi:hypothetical protein
VKSAVDRVLQWGGGERALESEDRTRTSSNKILSVGAVNKGDQNSRSETFFSRFLVYVIFGVDFVSVCFKKGNPASTPMILFYPCPYW